MPMMIMVARAQINMSKTIRFLYSVACMLCNKHSRNYPKNSFNLSPQQHMAIHMELIIREAVLLPPFGERMITVNQNVFNQLMEEL